ncbi:MAG: hypothetical protein IPJ94_11265 [Chloroflexi bacterium]|nr:hypothetical protein [Chloroflexota bacterium]
MTSNQSVKATAVGDQDARQVADMDLTELQRRAGGLARELGRQYGFSGPEWRTHWSDMTQTALLAFLENSDQPLSYAYACARTALKNYGWVHVRGLNGGWKSLVARDYTLVDTASSIDANDENGDDNLAWRLRQARPWDMVPRPVEWAVLQPGRWTAARSGRPVPGCAGHPGGDEQRPLVSGADVPWGAHPGVAADRPSLGGSVDGRRRPGVGFAGQHLPGVPP